MGVGLWWWWVSAETAEPTRPLTQRSGEEKFLIQLCSGFDGLWLGSTPCLASEAAQDGQGGLTVKQIQMDSHQLVLKPCRNLPSQLPRVLFIVRHIEFCKVIC